MRFRYTLVTGVTMAEYFRDLTGKEVLLFIDYISVSYRLEWKISNVFGKNSFKKVISQQEFRIR
jgi:F0F1-type ATP synthase beta subunit